MVPFDCWGWSERRRRCVQELNCLYLGVAFYWLRWESGFRLLIDMDHSMVHVAMVNWTIW